MIEDDELRNLFQAESEEKLKSLEEQLRKLEINPQDQEAIESAFRDAHTMKGSARMLNIDSIETITHQLENLLDKARKKEIILSSQGIQSLYEAVYGIQSLVNEAMTGEPAKIDMAALSRVINYKNLSIKEDPAPPHPLSPEVPLATTIEKEIPKPSITNKEEEPSSPSDLPEKIDEPSLPKQGEHVIKKIDQNSSISTVRIDIQQINNLMNQAADLTVAKNRMVRLFENLENLLDSWGKKYRTYQQPNYFLSDTSKENHAASKAIFEAFKEIGEELEKLRNETYDDVNKLESITSSFTEHTLRLSLLPLSKLFDFFPRMVRDLAKSTGKEVELIIEGNEITVDKKIIENMKDPLMHLLRNAISHGIETPDERKKNGKPSKGVIQLIGKHNPTTIQIEVSDDGRGLDGEKIKAVAIERHLLNQQESKNLTHEEMHALIFLPGFSTASEVSDISGRGVGLDVVKKEVEKLHGTITIESVLNQGSRFLIELPIIHITTQVILCEVDKRIYAIPMDMIDACLLISPDQVSKIEGNDVIMVDNHPISIIFFKNLININENSSEKVEFLTTVQPCILVKSQGKKVALIFDVIVDQQKIVIIPPNRFLSQVPSIIGTTILKTGEVCIVLNPFNLGTALLGLSLN